MSEASTGVATARPARPAWVVRLGAVLVASLANGVVWLVADAAGVDFTVEPPGQGEIRVDLVLTIIITFVTGLAAWGVLALLERFTRRGYGIWLGVAVIVFLVFLIPPLTSEATTGVRIALTTMHAVEAVVLAVGFRPARR